MTELEVYDISQYGVCVLFLHLTRLFLCNLLNNETSSVNVENGRRDSI